MNKFKQNMEVLVEQYEAEECNFDLSTNRKMLELYISRMEDCHIKCVLYKFLEQTKDLI